MSFKLFFLSTFKGLKNTSKVEAAHDNLWADYQEFIAVEQSGELKEFLDLEQFVHSETFKKQKKEVQLLKFKGSTEEKQLLEFKRLAKNKKLMRFYLTKDSSDLKRYSALEDSELINRYLQLNDYVITKKFKTEKESFTRNKNKDDQSKFEETEAYSKHQEYQQLKSSTEIAFWSKYPKSSDFRNYKKMINSAERKRFEELTVIVESTEFIVRKAYLEDDNKWKKTEACQKELAYFEMKKQPRFINYLKYKGSSEFDFFRNWELVFEDRFENEKLDDGKWKTIAGAAQKTIGRNFSKAGDLHGYTDGDNVQIKNNHLRLVVKKEKTESMVWNFPVGFTPLTLEYSSGLLTTDELFQSKYGILEAKVKFQPQDRLVDIFYLSDATNEHRLNLLECGKVNRLGFSSSNGSSQHESLSGLQAGKFYIFRMEWESGKVRWKINNHEIFELTQHVPAVPMHINLSSIVIEPLDDLPHYFELDWVRFFQKRK